MLWGYPILLVVAKSCINYGELASSIFGQNFIQFGPLKSYTKACWLHVSCALEVVIIFKNLPRQKIKSLCVFNSREFFTLNSPN